MTVANKVQSKVPQLRFPEFSGDWCKSRISDLVKSGVLESPMDGNHGETHPKASDYVAEGIPFVMANDIVDGELKIEKTNKITKDQADGLRKGFSKEGDILLTHKGTIGVVAIVPKLTSPYIMLTPQVTYYRVKNDTALKRGFLKAVFQSASYFKQLKIAAASGTRPYVGITEQASLFITHPEDDAEQNSIDTFHDVVDKKISLLKQKHEQLVLYKKCILQQLFSQQLRFKDDDGQDFPDWDVRALSSIAKKVSAKNKDDSVKSVLTNSAKHGIVNQLDYFDKDIANENNLTNYCVVEKNDFVYNPRISVHAPVGPIKRNHICKGVMSPLYTVFRFKDVELLDFVEIFFGTTFWHRYMNSIANFGARHDRMNITSGDFFALPIKVPCVEERIKLVDFVKSIDKKINLTQLQIEQTQAYKQGLLQQMFV